MSCNEAMCDGNRDDPSFMFCGLAHNHGGAHGKWTS